MNTCDYCKKPLRKTFVTGFGYGGAVRFYHKICAIRRDQVGCETCGKLIDYHNASHQMELDTGYTSWYCSDCDGFLYEPDGALYWDEAAEKAWESLMREGA